MEKEGGDDECIKLCESQQRMELATNNHLLDESDYLTIHANVMPFTMNMIGKTTFIAYYLMIRGVVEDRFDFVHIISPDMYTNTLIYDCCKSLLDKNGSPYLFIKYHTNKSLYLQNKLTGRRWGIRFSRLADGSSLRGLRFGLTIFHDFYEADIIKLQQHNYHYIGPYGGKIILLVKTFSDESLVNVNSIFNEYVSKCIERNANGHIFLVRKSSSSSSCYYPYLGDQNICV
jgi:hypothetical protein